MPAVDQVRQRARRPTIPVRRNGRTRARSESKNYATAHRPLPAIDYKNSAAVAATVDKLILQNLTETGTNPAPKTSDEDFLRRVHFDLAGTVPLPSEVTMFGLDPDSDKRMKVIDKLLVERGILAQLVGLLARRDLYAGDRQEGPLLARDIREVDGRPNPREPELGQDHHGAAHGDG